MPETVILKAIVGSTAYGLTSDSSDVDTMGVYVANYRDVLGLDGPEKVAESRQTHEPDMTMHEVAKFLKLALKCNPAILEILWMPEYLVCTREGAFLKACRKKFLYKQGVRNAYGNYAEAQATRLIHRHEEGKEGFSSDVKQRTAKHGRHVMRLILQGSQLLKYGEITVNVSDHRDKIFEMGDLAANNPKAFFSRYVDLATEFDAIESCLPESNDRDWMNELLIYIRESLRVV